MILSDTSWCPHCQDFKPEYVDIAKKLKERKQVTVAKVDASEQKALNKRFGVTSIPAIFLFKSGIPFEFTGPRTADDVLAFVSVKINAPKVKMIKSPQHARSLDHDQPMILIGCFKTAGSKGENAIMELNSEVLPFPVYITRSQHVIDFYGANDTSVIIVKHFIDDNGVATYDGKPSAREIKKWAEDNYYAE